MNENEIEAPLASEKYSIGWGQLMFLPFHEPDPKMSRRRRRRLRGKRKAGLLKPWGFEFLGEVEIYKVAVARRQA
ncbi:hypothetical protein ASF49_08295 [Methylobacterium sp. Leaf104]|uniref:hypothetical protein n=1 Tax=Methylobacterium TaxID=407 RepID=UPI0006FA58E2|nr:MULTISPECIES: hypothetical protein [Methylobacterium]KQP33856.1 hypothetical protein ASF49_08295 [Methylobacterium sp. Leaf104]MCI9879573.1 hypothetical protein [Methylobacterium goesingense]